MVVDEERRAGDRDTPRSFMRVSGPPMHTGCVGGKGVVAGHCAYLVRYNFDATDGWQGSRIWIGFDIMYTCSLLANVIGSKDSTRVGSGISK